MLQTSRHCWQIFYKRASLWTQADTLLFGAIRSSRGSEAFFIHSGDGAAHSACLGQLCLWKSHEKPCCGLVPLAGNLLLGLMLLNLLVAAPRGRTTWQLRVMELQDGVICLGLWPCWESSSLVSSFSGSCQMRLSILFMETWRVKGWWVQGSCPVQ